MNTSDSRVELIWDVARSAALSEAQRAIIQTRLARRLVGGTLTVIASERRSQLRNRETALARLAELVAAALAPDAAPRRPTKATRGSKLRRLTAKSQRATTKQMRQRPSGD